MEWPEFGGPKLKGINQASGYKEWFITNPVPGGLKGPNILLKPMNVKVPGLNPSKKRKTKTSGKNVKGLQSPRLPKSVIRSPNIKAPKLSNPAGKKSGRTSKKKSKAGNPPDFRRFKL